MFRCRQGTRGCGSVPRVVIQRTRSLALEVSSPPLSQKTRRDLAIWPRALRRRSSPRALARRKISNMDDDCFLLAIRKSGRHRRLFALGITEQSNQFGIGFGFRQRRYYSINRGTEGGHLQLGTTESRRIFAEESNTRPTLSSSQLWKLRAATLVRKVAWPFFFFINFRLPRNCRKCPRHANLLSAPLLA